MSRSRISLALGIGFGVTLVLWLFMGTYFVRQVSQLTRQAEEVNARYRNAQDALATIRTQVLLGSIYLRDALLDSDHSATAQYQERMLAAYTTAREALATYEPVLNEPAELSRLNQLRFELDDYFAGRLLAADNADLGWVERARRRLRADIVPKRQALIRLSSEIQGLTRDALEAQQARIAALHALVTARITWSCVLALLTSCAVAFVATRHSAKLEAVLRTQRDREQQTAQELARLSARVVSAQEDERREIARELHDDVGQVLAAIKVELSLARMRIESAGGPAHFLDGVGSIADRALQSVRDVSHLLHPALLDDLGLPVALSALVKTFNARGGPAAHFRHTGATIRLAPATEISLYRIAQEALTNVARHSHATECHVSLEVLDDAVTLTIDDNGEGIGPDVASTRSPGLGLVGIRERVAQLDGDFRMETAVGKGTRLSIALPAKPRAREDVEAADTVYG